MSDFQNYMHKKDITARWRAESNHASSEYERAIVEERCAELLSQHEPVASIGIDRDQLRSALHFVLTGRIKGASDE